MVAGGRRAGLLAICLAVLCSAAGVSAAGPPAEAAWPDPAMTVKAVALDVPGWIYRSNLAESLGLLPGRPYRREDAVRALNMLRASGSFSSAGLTTTLEPDGVTLRYDVVPVELVSSVKVKGNFFLLEREIRTVVRVAPQEALDKDRVEKDAARIRDLYERRGFFDPRVTVRYEPDKGGGGTDVGFEVKEGKPGVIQKVTLEGVRGLPVDDLAARSGLVLFTFFDPEAVEIAAGKILESLRAANFIEARVDVLSNLTKGAAMPGISLVQPVKSLRALIPGEYVGVEVIFHIRENDRFDIRVTGNTAFDEPALLSLTTFRRAGFFDPYEAEESRRAILGHYRDNGYYNANVTVTLDRESRKALFAVREGRLVSVEKILFTGNAFLDSDDLLAMMDSRQGWTGKTLYRQDVLERDLKKIKAAYVSHGFSAAEAVVGNSELNDVGDRLALNIHVSEGPRTLLGEVLFEGAAVFDRERLSLIVKRKPGDPFEPDWIDSAKKGILDLYSRLGYADCSISAIPAFSTDGTRVDVRFEIREGARRVLGRVLIVGNRATRARTILRELRMKEGQPYDPIGVFETRRRLFERGIFSKIELVNPPAGPDGVTDLVIRVRERNTRRWALGFGYDSEEKARGFVEVSENNLFGTARGVKLRYKQSTIGRRYDFFFREPWALGFREDANLNLYDETRAEDGYDLHRRGGKPFAEWEPWARTGVLVAYRYEEVRLSNVTPEMEATGELPESYLISSVIGRISWDGRDNPVNPHRGLYASAQAELAPSFLGGEALFDKYEGQVSLVTPVTARSELVLMGRMGLARLLDPDDRLPISERFFAGGASTVRGYAERSLGPTDADGTPLGGDLLLVGNAEYRFPVYRGVGGVVFFDIGNVWERTSDFSVDGLKSSVGFGLRYETPVGPIRLEYGRKLSSEPGQSAYRIHFTLGYPF
jgi:outer membrane protein insertion porin family